MIWRESMQVGWTALQQQPIVWSVCLLLAVAWMWRVIEAAIYMPSVDEITRPEFDCSTLDGSNQLPGVSIIVPARNEAEHIEPALRSLLRLEYSRYEVIAIDDRSDDETGTVLDWIATEFAQRDSSETKLKIIHISELPAGWLGKTHAMWTAARCATYDWLLFTDADVVYRGDALRRAMAYAEREQADHVVLFPTMLLHSIGERMMMAFFQTLFVFTHRPWKVADPQSSDHMGVGAFNLIRRKVYEDLGTYERLRMAVLDDIKLGELVKMGRYRQRNVFGRDLLRLRWFAGVRGMVRNLTKNFFAIMHYDSLWTTGAIGSILLLNLVPFLGFVLTHGWLRAGFAVSLAAITCVYIGMARKSDISPLYFFLHPIGTVLFCYTVARSMLITLMQGGVVWRGTWYPLGDLKKFAGDRRKWG